MVASRRKDSTKHVMWMVWGLTLLAVVLSVNLVFGRHGIGHVLDLRALLAELSDQTYERTVRNHRLALELYGLRTDEKVLSSFARTEFGLVRSDELVFIFDTEGEARSR